MATKLETVAPVQNVCAAAVGAAVVFTVILIVAVVAHCPVDGVNV